jgi:hypothetical protein
MVGSFVSLSAAFFEAIWAVAAVSGCKGRAEPGGASFATEAGCTFAAKAKSPAAAPDG